MPTATRLPVMATDATWGTDRISPGGDEKEASFVAVCDGRVLFCKQRGREVVRGCGAPLSYELCKRLWGGVIAEVRVVEDGE